ncbi:MAG: CDP-glycerol glycerophosphotransferase family protein [Nocardioides sp.]|uniref:CDP-glycerol glycerophosphotransferase family protein n=1 Tax=Nocardioides sp. TaxID=35761 RepID=UPI0039E45650
MAAGETRHSRALWLFNCADTFSGNPKWLFLYVNRFRPDIEAWWITPDAGTVAEVRRLGFNAVVTSSRQGQALQNRASVWVVNQVKEVISPRLRGAVLLNLWHGVGVKSIERGMNEGYLQERIFRKYITNNQAYHDRQLFLVTSPAMERHFAKQIGFGPDQAIRAGYPQDLYTRLYGEVSTFDHDLPARRGLAPDARIALYAPTPRREFDADFLAEAFPDLPRLIETLRRENILLILKMHPHMTKDPAFRQLRAEYGDEPHLMFWDNEEDIYEVFHKIDLAIVDYSSILYDLLSAGVSKVIRYVFDLDFDAAGRGDGGNAVIEPGTDYLELSCGSIASDFDELLTRLGEDCRVPEATLARLHDYFWAYADDQTFETIVQRALDFEPTHDRLPTFHSFDVFDTVIARKVVEPDGIFYYVRHMMEQSPDKFPAYVTAEFVRLRMEAESNVRESRRKHPDLQASGDLEITFDQIYERLADLHRLDHEQIALLKGWELEAELDNVIPCDAQIQQIRDLLDDGATVVLISDQYLPIDVVRRMLAKADPMLAELPLYLSNEQHAQKSTRKLYLKVFADQEEWHYGRWHHVGDNPHADILRARELGIDTRRVRTPRFTPYERRLATALDTYDGRLLAGLFRQDRVQLDLSHTERFVYARVALYLVPYLEWVLGDAIARGYRTLYFVSRDGHHLKEIADTLIAEHGLNLRTRYIYGSRRAWRLASQVDGIDANTFSAFGNFAGVQSVAELAETASLSVAELHAMVPETRQYGDAETRSRAASRELRESLAASATFRRHLERQAREDRDLVTAYLQQEIDVDEPFAVVEYWGRGYTQDCLVRLIAHATGRPVPTPFYYARSIYLTDGDAIRHNFTSSTHSMLFVEAIFANLPYGTVEGYRRDGERVVPVMTPRACDAELYEAMATQLPRFARDFARLPFVDRDRVRRALLTFAFDDFEENKDDPHYLDRIAHLRDAVDLGATEREFAPALTLADFVRHMKGERISTLTRSLEMSEARSGAMALRLFEWRQRYDWPRWIPPAERKPDDPRRWRRDAHDRAVLEAARRPADEPMPAPTGPLRRRIRAVRRRLGGVRRRMRSAGSRLYRRRAR